MRRQHFDRLAPVCPTCRAQGRVAAPLAVNTVIREDVGDDIREGILVCTEPQCQREHPIIDGIAVVVADLQSWASHQLEAVLWRDDLSHVTESLLGDAAGPSSVFERERTALSAYGRVHWGDFDCDQPLPRDATVAGLVDAAFDVLPVSAAAGGPWIDLGCAVGRATREVACRSGDLTVGVDLSFAMLRVAERARLEGRVRFPLRRVGLVYDRREFSVDDMPRDDMSFWCCDVGNLPFADGTFNGVLSLNVLDCVASPLQHLMEVGRLLTDGAPALVTTPYDWSAAATPLAQWLGGHSQRSAAHGSSAAEVRRVLQSVDLGLTIEAERERTPWRVYVNDRAWMDYAVHLLSLRRTSARAG